jgi:hypothetical protein
MWFSPCDEPFPTKFSFMTKWLQLWGIDPYAPPSETNGGN